MWNDLVFDRAGNLYVPIGFGPTMLAARAVPCSGGWSPPGPPAAHHALAGIGPDA